MSEGSEPISGEPLPPERAGAPAPSHESYRPSRLTRGLAMGIAGWVVPGLGHLLLGRWGKALAYFLSVGALAYTGWAMHGLVFPPSSSDLLDRLGFFADLGTGSFYLAARASGVAADLAHASGDYGTRLFATAGILNLLTVLEAYDISLGRKS